MPLLPTSEFAIGGRGMRQTQYAFLAASCMKFLLLRTGGRLGKSLDHGDLGEQLSLFRGLPSI